MKWIGQHIWDLISRFRSDVYMEDISTGTIASGGNLGLDSSNKIVKATLSSGGISHDGSTANGVLTFKDSDEATVESNLTFDGNNLAIPSGNIELGHATDTTISRNAAGVAAVEGKKVQTRDKIIYIETSNFSDDIATTAHYIHFKANNHTNTSSNTVTFRLDRLDDGQLWNSGNEATIGTKVVDGVNRVNTCSADFQDLTTSGASGTNAFDANEMLGVSMQNSQNLTSTKYSVTLVFEFDFNSY